MRKRAISRCRREADRFRCPLALLGWSGEQGFGAVVERVFIDVYKLSAFVLLYKHHAETKPCCTLFALHHRTVLANGGCRPCSCTAEAQRVLTHLGETDGGDANDSA